ncbi:hypothetical protein H6H03_14040 [Nostoc paludosum FACHB-159]|uniref:Uncharacterized protein n=1 Tax=Nostoc paludosum FACHB-159 TaxID=2692908 RepID=A0ABR8K692_9NOSO|nr:hypothetical protein [Nostoc paludosum FACHB-159]
MGHWAWGMGISYDSSASLPHLPCLPTQFLTFFLIKRKNLDYIKQTVSLQVICW